MIRDRYNWWSMLDRENRTTYDPLDKRANIDAYISEQLLKVLPMIRISGLPETIPERDIKLMLLCNGWCGITEVKNPVDVNTPQGLYAVVGGLGGVSAYNTPTFLSWAQSQLGSAQPVIDKDCIIVKNDPLYMGIYGMFSRFASQIVETDLTLRCTLINQRIQQLISCDDDNTRKAAECYINDVIAGKIGIASDNAMIGGLKVSPYSTAEQGRITSLIELKQYLIGQWDLKIGLASNYNMKRETITAGESVRDDDGLISFVDLIHDTWSADFDRVNDFYGTKITVELASAWERRQTMDTGEIEDERKSDNFDTEDTQ